MSGTGQLKLPPADGPSLEQYVETRFNLLSEVITKMEGTIYVRIDAGTAARVALEKQITTSVEHLTQLFNLVQDNARRANDKSEASQAAVNVASNEWRNTLNDFKSTLITKSEFDRLSADFAAYRLEQSRIASQQAGQKEGAKENKDDSKAMWALAIAVATALVSIAALFMKRGGL